MPVQSNLSFWQNRVDFPLDNLDLLYLCQILREFSSRSKTPSSTEIWANSALVKIETYFIERGLRVKPYLIEVKQGG